MALLPLAGWSQTFTDLSDGWAIELDATAKTYNGNKQVPTVKLKKGTEELTTGFNVSWSPNEPQNWVSGGYTVTVTADDVHTYNALATPTAKFFIMKAQIAVSNTPALWTGGDYDSNAHPLVTTAPTINLSNKGATVEYSVNNGDWSSTIPTATLVGTYAVRYRVQSGNNWVGIDPTDLGTVTINGLTIPAADITAPVGKTGLTFTWENGAAKAQQLITAGAVDPDKGEMQYKVGSGSYSTSIPTGTNANSYTVKWKVVGKNGYKDTDETALSAITIAQLKPTTVTNATGNTGLVYAGDADPYQALIATAGSATEGASVKYQKRFKATADATWPTDWDAATANKDDIKGDKAGYYQIKTIVETGGNYLANTDAEPIEVTIAKAPAFTSAPTANDLTWNNDAQQLITAGAGTVTGKVKYSTDYNPETESGTWTITDPTTITQTRANTYNVFYKVDDANYQAVTPKKIAVTIKKKPISVKVNDITKVYDNTANLTGATVDGGGDAFTFITPITGAADFGALTSANYVAVSQKNAGSYADVVTIPMATLTSINTDKNYDYEYTIVPGKLTISQRPLYVTAKAGLSAKYGETYDISKEYTITGTLETGDPIDASTATASVISKYFSTAPVLTTDAAAVNPEEGEYDLAFTAGTTTANYTMDLTKGENEDGYVIGGNKFTVNPDPDKKIIITVLPHTQAYTGVAESWDNLVEGTDYVVSGLISGDALTTAPTFTRSNADKFDAAEYTLSASGAAVADPSKYPGGIIYNNSTFTIQPVELTATVNQQTLTIGDDGLPYADAWSVTGLVNNETKAVLNGVLSINTTEGTDGEKAVVGTVGLYTKGIKLAITSTNYTLKEGTQWGALRVIATTTLELDPTDANLAEKIEAAKYVEADANTYNVTFANKTLKANTWYSMVLPFSVKTTELVNQLKDKDGEAVYAIVNRFSKSQSSKGNIKFVVEMKEIPANEPFMIKAASEVNLQGVTFNAKQIVYKEDLSVSDTDGDKFVGTYTAKAIQQADGIDYGWYDGEATVEATPKWRRPVNSAHTMQPMEAYLQYAEGSFDNGSAPVISFEDILDGATAIKTFNVEGTATKNAEGWYTLNGMKLDVAPTQKGIYIKDGKKVVIK